MKKKLSKTELKKKQSEAGKKAYQTKMANLAKKNGTKVEPQEGETHEKSRKIIMGRLFELYALVYPLEDCADLKKAIENYLYAKM